jgi:SSS family solute:Na+ symporter
MARVQNPAGGVKVADSALPDLGMGLLPVGIRGFFMAALLAAVMSTADSYLHVAASSFSNDIYRFLGKKKDEKRMISMARASVVMFGLLSLVIAFWLQTIVSAIIFLLTVWISGMLLPIILSYKFRLRARTAFVGMLSGAIASISWKAVSYYIAVPAYADPLFIGIGACLLGLIIAERVWR